jgi:hypothetical protein
VQTSEFTLKENECKNVPDYWSYRSTCERQAGSSDSDSDGPWGKSCQVYILQFPNCSGEMATPGDSLQTSGRCFKVLGPPAAQSVTLRRDH